MRSTTSLTYLVVLNTLHSTFSLHVNFPLALTSDPFTREAEDTFSVLEAQEKHRQFMVVSDDIVSITAWYGRLGNNLIQIANALEIAESTGATVSLPEGGQVHESFTLNQTIPVIRLDSKTKCTAWSHGFPYAGNKNEHCFTSDERNRVMRKYLYPSLKPSTVDTDANELVIHVRGGDKLKKDHHPQPPCAAYDKVIHEAKYTRVRIIASERDGADNPCWAKLKSLPARARVEVNFQSLSLHDDFSTLVKARNLFVAYSTFSAVAYWLSAKNVNTYTMAQSRVIGEGIGGNNFILLNTTMNYNHSEASRWYEAPEEDIHIVPNS